MLYELKNGKAFVADTLSLDGSHRYFGLFDDEQSREILKKCKFSSHMLTESLKNTSMIFENHEGYDFACINVLNRKNLQFNSEKVCIYMQKNMILFICNDVAMLENIFDKIREDENLNLDTDRILCNFFERLTVFDVSYLEKIEQEIADLENALIATKKRDCVAEIISLRKRLMVLKRYYEQLLDVLDELQENENALLTESALRYFKIFAGKADRYYHNIMNLRDYVTQVREAYQAEVDIGLNSIMKIFTVITAIFLPLTLLVGWYGMNLQMPEFHWAYGYPTVIAVSIIIVIFCLICFKKKKWF